MGVPLSQCVTAVVRSSEDERFDLIRDEVVAYRVVNPTNKFPKMQLVSKAPDSNMGWEVKQSQSMFYKAFPHISIVLMV